MRSAFLSAMDGWLKQNNKYNKNEAKITWPDVQETLIFVSNNFSTQTSYENQTKKAVDNRFIQEGMTEFLREKLQIFLLENPQAVEEAARQILVSKRSREAGEKARLSIKSKSLAGSVDIANRVQKFVDCRTKEVARRELYIVEGDSALGSVKLGRDAEFQGIMPVRGKILNCLKADYGKIFKSEIITDLLKVMGCGVEVNDKHNKDLSLFNLANLRWNKIVICTDADVDGYQIRTLILTMLWRLTPTLIQEGYVYIAESPLYEINAGGKTWFAYSEKEKAEILTQLDGKKPVIQRSKGLGENDPEMMWMTTMNPAGPPQDRKETGVWTTGKQEKQAGPSSAAAVSLSFSQSSGWGWPWRRWACCSSPWGAGAPTAGRFCSSCPPTPTSAPSATAPCKRARWWAPPGGICNRGTTGIWQEKNHLTRVRNGSIPRG